MKVLLVNSEKGMRGGEHQTAALGLGLKRKGCEVRLAVPPGAPIIDRISGFLPFVTFRFETLPFGTPASLSRLIATWKPDILHAQTSRAHTHLWIARLFLKDAPPLVVSRRVAFGVSGCVSGRFKYRMGVAHYIPISMAAAKSLRDAGVLEERMTIVPSGVDVERFRRSTGDKRLLEGWGVGADRFLIGTVAAFEKEKGYGALLGASEIVLALHPECLFVFVGSGRFAGELRKRILVKGLGDKVVVAGLENDLEDVLPLFNLFVLPSLQEGLSTALIAALAAGLPVVASRTGGIPEVVNTDCGILVPPDDKRALAEAIISLIRDGGLRGRLAKAGSRRAGKFDIRSTIDGTIGVYKMVLG